MKAWTLALVLLVPGGSLLFAIAWLRRRHRRWLGREAALLDRQLVARGERLDDRLKGQTHDESLEARARARREIAESIRKHSNAIRGDVERLAVGTGAPLAFSVRRGPVHLRRKT